MSRAGPCSIASLSVLGVAMFAGASQLTDTTKSQYAKVQAIGLRDVTWTSGFWEDRFATCRDRSLPAMWDLMKSGKYKPYYQHFLIAAGELEGEHRGAPWNDGDFYKWIEAACSVLATRGDPELAAIIDQCVSAIGRAQRDDGYIHTPVQIRRRNGDSSAQPFQDRHNFEMYNMGHLITAACLHHRVTGQDDFLSIARKTAAFLERAFAEPTPQLARNSVCPSHYMALSELYRATSDPRHLHLAQTLFDMRGIVRDGGDDNQDRIPFHQQREAVGHAVRANYLYAGAADLFLETGDPRLWTPLEALWENVTTKKCISRAAAEHSMMGRRPMALPGRPSYLAFIRPMAETTSCPTSRHTTKRVPRSATCCGIGACFWQPALRVTSTL